MGMTLLTITTSDPLPKLLLPVPVSVYSVVLDVLAPKGEMLPPGNAIKIPLNWKAGWPLACVSSLCL